MKNSTRKLLALVLTLVLICALAVAAFATPMEIEGEILICGRVNFYTHVEGDSTYGMARAIVTNEESFTNAFNGTIRMSYTICPEDQIRPLYYEEGTTTTQSFSRASGARFTSYQITNTRYCMIDATGHTYMKQILNGSTFEVTARPVTLDLT